MVTIAQGKFSKPRPPRPEEPVRPVRERVAADPIEKAEADIARFMDTVTLETPVQPAVTDETVVIAADTFNETIRIVPEEGSRSVSPISEDATQVIPQFRDDATQAIPQIPQDATRVLPRTPEDTTQVIRQFRGDVTQVIPQVSQDATRVLPRTPEDATRVIPQPQTAAPRPAPQPNRQPPQPQRRPVPQPPVEEDYEDEPTFLQRNKKPVLIGCCAAILLLIIAIIAMVVSLRNTETDDGRILNNVIVAGVNVGGMTPEQAKSAVETATADVFSTTMEVLLPDCTLEFTAADTDIFFHVDGAVEAAYNYGRVGTEEEIERAKAQTLVGQYVVDLLPYLQMDATYIHDTLKEYGESFNSSYASSSYSVEGTKPGLTADTFDENAPCQTLVLRIGTPGRNLDMETVYTDVLAAYSTLSFRVDASSAPEEMPELPDLDAIFKELCSTPVDAYMDMQTFAVNGEVYGYTFDLESAKENLNGAEFGSAIRIPMEYIIPEVVSEDLSGSLFADALGTYQTKHTNNKDRNTNISLACQAINGTVLEPGAEFSFNDVVGERTAARGYRKAPAYSSGETVSELGGGICQVSSTLYYAVLLADLDVTARQNHSYVSSYIPMGLDATVSWGGPEFKFRNSTSYPIRIEAEISGGNVTVRLMGTDKRDYYVEMEYEVAGYLEPETEYKEFDHDNKEGYSDGDVIEKGSTGYVVDTYKHKFDKETGEEIEVKFETRSSYRPHNEIVAKVEPAPTTVPPTEAPTEKPTEAPTEKPTEKPTEAPTEKPTEKPTEAPTEKPTEKPTEAPTEKPTEKPTEAPTEKPTEAPTEVPTEAATEDVAG